MEPFDITMDVLNQIGKLNKKHQKLAFQELGKMEYTKCANDLMYWLDKDRHILPYVHTLDNAELYLCNVCKDGLEHEADKRSAHLRVKHSLDIKTVDEFMAYYEAIPPIRPFPMKPYIKPLADTWQTEKYFLVQKTRNVIATWTFVAFHAWLVLFHPGKLVLFQGQTAPKTLELVNRVNHIYTYMPKFLREAVTVECIEGQSRAGIFRVPSIKSEIVGLGKGADQVRQFHPSSVFLDEVCFINELNDIWTAVKPAIQHGGKVCGISSANPSFAQLLMQDLS